MTETGGDRKRIPIIAFVSGKGGCGKTTLAINFASTVSKAGARVLLVDLDLNNHGSTGAFAAGIALEGCLTATDILLGRDGLGPAIVRDRIVFVPAGRPGEPIPSLERPGGESELAGFLRTALVDLAEKHEASCVVVDCFCGIDTLTTASLGSADHVVVVNEPDPITFSGSLHLIKHVKEQFKGWPRSPKLHVAINRMRPPQTVRSLAYAYRDNLSKELQEAILCHVPYNDRIFRNFGRHPIAVELIPHSLFARKLELLAYALFHGVDDELLRLQVRNWSRRKLERIYTQSFDPNAVDAEYLVLKLTMFPVFAAAWLITFLLIFNARVLTPFGAWLAMTLAVLSGFGILVYSLIHGFWLAARLNLTLAFFRKRVAATCEDPWEQVRHYVGAGANAITGTLMVLFVASGYTILGSLLIAWLNDYGLKSHFVKVALAAPANVLDLRGQEVEDVNLSTRDLTSNAESTRGLDRKRVLVGNDTRLVRVRLYHTQLSNRTLDGLSLDECIVTGSNPGEQGNPELVIRDSTLTNLRLIEPRPLEGLHFSRIVFLDSKLKNVTIEVSGGIEIELTTQHASGVTIVKRDQGELGVRVLVPGELVDKIATRGFVSVLSASQPEKETTLNSRIEGTEKLLQKVQGAGERDAAGWSDLINLTELYILRGARADLTQARTNIQTIGRKPAEYEGYALLLGLMLSTMYEPNDAAVAAAEKWVEWLKSGRVTNSWGWNWSLWYEPGRVPEPKLKAIRLIDGASPRVDEGAAGASAQNRLTPDQFLEAFRRELGVSEKSEEPRLYVQIGAGRNLGALKNWAKQLEGEGRKTLIFEIPGGDVPRYAITLDRHAPAEAKRLAEEWRASDPKHQAWVLEGKTYKRQVR